MPDPEGSDVGHESWMSRLPNNTRINQISMPGTHDSTARFGSDQYVCQSLSLEDQLSMGVRFFDIRLILAEGILKCQHGRVYQNLHFSTVLKIMTTFLWKNPSEAVFLKIQQEHTRYSDVDFSSAVTSALENIRDSIFSATATISRNNIPSISDVRGRMTIVPRFFTIPCLNTIQYESTTAQDDFKVSMADKAISISNFYNAIPLEAEVPPFPMNITNSIEARWQHHRPQVNIDVPMIGWYINYFSLHNNIESPAIAAQSLNPLIATLILKTSTPADNGAPDFRDAPSFTNSTRIATSITSSQSKPGIVKKMGVVMMDFISPEAARLIIESNFILQ